MGRGVRCRGRHDGTSIERGQLPDRRSRLVAIFGSRAPNRHSAAALKGRPRPHVAAAGVHGSRPAMRRRSDMSPTLRNFKCLISTTSGRGRRPQVDHTGHMCRARRAGAHHLNRGITSSHSSCSERIISSAGIAAPKLSSNRMPSMPNSSSSSFSRSVTLSGLPTTTLSRSTVS